MFAFFQSSGIFLCLNEALNNKVIIGVIFSAKFFCTTGLMLSGPAALFGFNFFNNFKTPFSVIIIESFVGIFFFIACLHKFLSESGDTGENN